MLEKEIFKTIVKNTPLVSIDLCIVWDGKILLGKRKNDPLKGFFFTPGGRILKNEVHIDCLKRVASSELGLIIDDIRQAKLMGVWDHFYANSIFGDEVSTHYVNLPHCIYYDKRPEILLDDQHDSFEWFDLSKVANGNEFHRFIKSYASWIILRKPQ
ncbi:NUDIX domain-containing protein [Pseudomonadales bacterium]|nr:NUDIX domain-containing protein [Pseudomonadales bacterium]